MMQGQFETISATDAVRMAVRPLVEIEDYMVRQDGGIVLHGQLRVAAEHVFRPLRARLEPLGFTPFLRRVPEGVEILALPGVVRHKPARLWINVVLFVLTVISVLATAALNEGASLRSPADWLRGVPFMLTLLGILGAHEMGHFIVGRWRGAPMSWPYFIPMPPFLSFTGTLGAVIVQREPLEDRKTLLQVGIAGPLAGLVVAIPLLFLGLANSTVGPPPAGGYVQEGTSLLYGAIKWLVFQQWLPANGVDVQLNPVAWGAWIGLLITMLNLLPVGQLDGGHIAYALLGQRAHYLAYATVLLALGMTLVWPSWGVLIILPLLTGIRHPPPFNDVPELDRKNTALAIFGLVVFVLLFMPVPLVIKT